MAEAIKRQVQAAVACEAAAQIQQAKNPRQGPQCLQIMAKPNPTAASRKSEAKLAMTAETHQPEGRKFSVRIESFRPLRQNGFVDLLIPEPHFLFRGASVHESYSKRWIGLPGKPQIGREGRVRRDERGKILYTPVIQFTDKATADALSARAIEAPLEAYPRAFGGRGAG
jgi:hypothetical protein